MQLKPDCVRDTLLYLEEQLTINFQQNIFTPINKKELIEGMRLLHTHYDAEDIWYTIYNLIQAGFIEGKFSNAGNHKMSVCEIENITWEGHQFLDSVRPDTIWDAVKSKAHQIGGISISGLSLISSSIIQGLSNHPDFIQSIINNIR